MIARTPLPDPADDDAAPSGLIERTLAVLELLSSQSGGLALTEISEHLRIPRSATHRLLNALIKHGYVRQERQFGAYLMTARLVSLALTFLSGSGVTDFAQPILNGLAREAGELVRLAMIDGRQLVWVAKAQGSKADLRYDPDMGQVGRLSCSASGHAWLACLSDEEALELVANQGFGSRAEFGPKAPETPEALLKALRATRRRGFSITIQTYSPWMNACAAAIRSPSTGDVTGAVVIAGPHVRFKEAQMLQLAPHLTRAAQELALAITASPALRMPRSEADSIFASPEPKK